MAVAALYVLGHAPQLRAEEPLNIVATTGQVADLVANIAGDRAEVTGLMGPGVDPHLYQPTRSDVALMLAADAVFYNGLFLEGRLEDTLERLGENAVVVAVGERIDPGFLIEVEAAADQYDPHIWMDARLWALAAEGVASALTEMDPAGAALYAENLAEYSGALLDLHEYAAAIMADVPEDNRVLVTAHDAFAYFGRAYGLEVEGIQGISTDSEAGLLRIGELVDLLVSRRIAAVFVETSVSDRGPRALIEGAAARGHEVIIGGDLYSDAMGPPGAYEGTYIGMLDHNVTVIARALGAAPPLGGLNGRLAVDQ